MTPDEPAVTKGLAYLEQFLGPKGGLSEAPAFQLHDLGRAHGVSRGESGAGVTTGSSRAGRSFSRRCSGTRAKGKGRESDYYGGAGYGGKNSRPDLSNTAFMMEALRDTGLPSRRPGPSKGAWFSSHAART